MKALTIWQPWASLIAIEAKRFETRNWSPPRGKIGGRWGVIGTRIAIHAAARRPKGMDRRLSAAELGAIGEALAPEFGRDWPDAVPLGAVICTATLVGAYTVVDHDLDTGALGLGDAVVGSAPLTAATADFFGDYGVGRWLWCLADVERIQPTPARGRQRLWEWAPPRGAVRILLSGDGPTPLLFSARTGQESSPVPPLSSSRLPSPPYPLFLYWEECSPIHSPTKSAGSDLGR